MPYKSYNSKLQALKNAKLLMNFTNANMLKLEINKNNVSIIKHLSEGFNTIAILVTPQQFIDFKKIKIVGKTNNEKKI